MFENGGRERGKGSTQKVVEDGDNYLSGGKV